MTLDQVKGLFADSARPFALYATAGSSAYAVVRIVEKGSDLNAGAVFVAALLGGLGALYWGKAWENRGTSKHSSEVEVAKASATPPPGTAQITAAPDVDVTVREAEHEPDPTMYGGPRA